MTSVCISNCVKDARHDARIPVRATYVNLYKWPESDAEFVRSVSFRAAQTATSGGAAAMHQPPRVVDSISCRQMYLRSYPFSKEEDHVAEKMRCFGKRHVERSGEGRECSRRRKRRCISEFKRMKEVSFGALFRIFHKLLSCSASIEVADQDKNF